MAFPINPFRSLLNLFGYERGRPPRVVFRDRDVMAGMAAQVGASVHSWFEKQIRLAANRFGRYQEFDMMDEDDFISCLTGDTTIPLLDGRVVPIQDLVGCAPFWVYSYDTSLGKIVPGRARDARLTGRKASLLEVVLDNGKKIRCTENHPFLLRSGQYCRADQLSSGMSLMPLYRRYDKIRGPLAGYEALYQPRLPSKRTVTCLVCGKVFRFINATHLRKHGMTCAEYADRFPGAPFRRLKHTRGRWTITHKQFAPNKKRRMGFVVHHKNFDKQDNRPENLEWMLRGKHVSLHIALGHSGGYANQTFEEHSAAGKKGCAIRWAQPGARERMGEQSRERWSDSDYKDYVSQRIREGRVAMTKEQRDEAVRKWREWFDNMTPKEYEQFRTNCVVARAQMTDEEVQIMANRISKTKRGWSKSRKKEFYRTMRKSWVRRRASYGSTGSTRDGWKKRRLLYGPNGRNNHRIVSVIRLKDREAVYDLTVDRYHNFAVGAGVFVHNSILTLYTEDAAQIDSSTGRFVWVTAENKDIEKILMETLDNVDLDTLTPSIIRNFTKYGDHFMAVLYAVNEVGIPVRVAGLRQEDPRRVAHALDTMGRTAGYMVGETVASQILTAETMDMKNPNLAAPWDFIHWRLGSMAPEDPAHGRSLLMSARRTYKFLSLMEQAVVLFRLRRHPDRLKWTVDTGDMSPEEFNAHVQMLQQSLRKNVLIDPDTGQVRGDLNPLSFDEDIFVPQSEGGGTDVSLLSGSTQGVNILDMDYYRKKLCGCLRVPPDFMGFSDTSGTLEAKTPLASQDIRYCRGVRQLQMAYLIGVTTLGQIDLAARGLDPFDKKHDFTAHLRPVTYLDELEMANAAEVKVRVIESMLDVGDRLGLDKDKWLPEVARIAGVPESLIKGATKEEPSEEKRRSALAAGMRELLEGSQPWDSSLSSHKAPIRFLVHGRGGSKPLAFSRDTNDGSDGLKCLNEAWTYFQTREKEGVSEEVGGESAGGDEGDDDDE